MDAAAIVTLVGVGLLIVVLAAYLIVIALILRRVSARLTTVLDALRAIPERGDAAAPAIDALNRELDRMRAALEGVAERAGERSERAAGDQSVEQRPG